MPNKERPLLSIIVSMYNTERYLRRCLDSICTQHYDNIEVICINDGSTDNSLKILQEYKQKDKRIRVISQKNKGVGVANNRGISLSKGTYIAFVEPDDYIAADSYTVLMREAVTHDAQVVKGNFYHVHEDATIVKSTKHDKTKTGRITNVYSNPCLVKGFISHWSAVYKRSFIVANAISFPTMPGASYQDIAFWFDVLLSCTSFYYVDHPVYYYQLHETQSINAKANKKVKMFLAAFAAIEKNIEKRQMAKNETVCTLYLQFLLDCVVKLIKIHRAHNNKQYLNYIKKFVDTAPCNEQMLEKRERTLFKLVKSGRFFLFLLTIISYRIRNILGSYFDRTVAYISSKK